MNDEIVEEVHQIRAKLYEETKDMTPQELISYFHKSSKEVRDQIAQIRASRKSANTVDQQKVVNQ